MYAKPTKYPKFCTDCGAALIWRGPQLGSYTADEGKRRLHFQLVCPEKKWYQILHTHPHRSYFNGVGASKHYYWKEETL